MVIFCDFRKSLHTLLSIWILKFSNFQIFLLIDFKSLKAAQAYKSGSFI